ncbi:MAG: hypothetical protein AAF092_14525 [Pseudomonadota bacterium]
MRRLLWASAISILTAATPAVAQSVDEEVIRQLRAQGYTEFDVRRTWLGRVRILASVGDEEREIILHPSNGSVLYDSLAGVFAARDTEDEEEDDEDSPVSAAFGDRKAADDEDEDDDPDEEDEGEDEGDQDDADDDDDDDDNGGDDD